MRFRKVGLHIVVPFLGMAAVLLTSFAWELYITRIVMPESLKSVGPIELGDLTTDVPVSTVLPEPTTEGNAYDFYIEVLNDYTSRRKLYHALPKNQRFTDEPLASPRELYLVWAAMDLRSFDTHALDSQAVPTIEVVSGKHVRYGYQKFPLNNRPETSSLIILAQTMLNAGNKCLVHNDKECAERIYKSVLRMGYNWSLSHLSLVDTQLGINIETRACHYLQVLYGDNDPRQAQMTKYSESLYRLTLRISRKYRQLDTPAAAKMIFESDTGMIWRTESLVAMYSGLYYHRISWPEARVIRELLDKAKRANRLGDADTIAELEKMKPSDFRNPGTEQTAKNQMKGAGS